MSNLNRTSATLEQRISDREMFQTCLIGAVSCGLGAIFGAIYGAPIYIESILIGGTALSTKYVIRYYRRL